MKPLHLLCLPCIAFLSLSPDGLAQSGKFSDVYRPGSRLYVYAVDGLSLRTTPDIKSAVIDLVKFQESVLVLPDTRPRVPVTNSGISGSWVKVRYGDKEGYQFDGYLSRWDPVQRGNKRKEIYEYLKGMFNVQLVSYDPPDSQQYRVYDRTVFDNGIEYTWSAPVDGNSIFITFPASLITYQEFYLLARLYFTKFFFDNPCPYQNYKMTCHSEGKTLLLETLKGGTCKLSYILPDLEEIKLPRLKETETK